MPHERRFSPPPQRLKKTLRVILLHELGYLCKDLSCDGIKWLPERVATYGMKYIAIQQIIDYGTGSTKCYLEPLIYRRGYLVIHCNLLLANVRVDGVC